MAAYNFISTTGLNANHHTLPFDQVFLCNELLLLDAGGLFGWIEIVDKDGKTHLKKRPYTRLNTDEKKRLAQIISASSIGGSFKQLWDLSGSVVG